MKISGHLLAMLVLATGCVGTIESGTDDTPDPTASDPVPSVDPGDITPSTESARIAIPILRGVDRASAFSVTQAKRLKNDHGVRFTGVYIGGPCSGGSGWTKTRVTDIANATGWQFMPIYVGQQSSSICGAHHLTYRQGQADGAAAAKRMRSMGWRADRDIPVALDVEAGTYYGSVGGSTSYVRGWVNAVHHAGYRAYVYGSPYALNHYHDAKVRIDAAWAASYFYSGFRRLAPGELDQMGGRFRHRNRAWQYAGNFYVSGVGDVDANTAHLILAPAPGGTNRALIAQRNAPESCGTLEPGEGLARGEALASCDGASTLAMTESGELELSVNGQVVWTAGTEGAGAVATFEDTGELVVLDDDDSTVFASGTGGFPEAHVALDGQGLSIVGDDRSALWTDRDGLLVQDAAADLSDATDEADAPDGE